MGVCLCKRLIVIGNLFIHSFIEQIFLEQLLCAGSVSGHGIQWLQAGDHEMAAVKGTHGGTPVRKNQLGYGSGRTKHVITEEVTKLFRNF